MKKFSKNIQKHKETIIAGAIAGALSAFAVVIIALGFMYPGENEGSILETNKNTVNSSAVTSESTIIDIVQKVNPAVVSIVATKEVPVFEQSTRDLNSFDDFFNRSPFGGFEFRVPQLEQKGTEEREVGGGSGFIVSSDGLVVTNRHVVVDTEASYFVFTNDGRKLSAEVVARDPFFDIAVMKISEKARFPFLNFGNSEEISLGQTAIAIGNALGEFQNSVSVGVISGLSRSVVAGSPFGQREQLDEVIQTDAAINPGNSGGPLLNVEGEVIGVNVAVALGSENIGFALPANIVKEIVDSVKKEGRIIRPFLGVRYVQINERIQEANNLPVDYGALVTKGTTQEELAVMPGSPADRAGISENNIILEIDGEKLTPENPLAKMIREKEVGEEVTLTILDNEEERTVRVFLKEAPADL